MLCRQSSTISLVFTFGQDHIIFSTLSEFDTTLLIYSFTCRCLTHLCRFEMKGFVSFLLFIIGRVTKQWFFKERQSTLQATTRRGYFGIWYVQVVKLQSGHIKRIEECQKYSQRYKLFFILVKSQQCNTCRPSQRKSGCKIVFSTELQVFLNKIGQDGP